MQEDLSRLTDELRKETCPQRVLGAVERRIAAKKSARARWRLAVPFVATAMFFAAGILTWRWQARERALQEARLAEQRTQTAMQAENALKLMGSMVTDAAVDSGKIISNEAVPPLRNSFETAKTQLTHSIL